MFIHMYQGSIRIENHSETCLNDVVWFKQNLAPLLLIIHVKNQSQHKAGLAIFLQFKAKGFFYLE